MNQFSNSFQQADFILKYLRRELTIPEKNELDAWLAANENNRTIFEELTNEPLLKNELQFFDTVAAEAAWQKIEGRIRPEVKLVTMKTNRRWWYVAAAVIFLIGAFAVYRFETQQPAANTPIAKTSTGKDDVAPGGNKAILTLADGSAIALDNAANGDLTEQGNTKVIKLDGQLAYKADGATTEVVYNTISTPRGGQYQLILADGSKVWLNAASSLRFPANFIGTERRVELTGEGYFEVTKNAAMPFKVDVAGKGEVEVLGTHFNVNAYSDESNINTTLLEGSVKVTSLTTHDSRLITPGQQAQQNSTGQISLDNNANIGQVMAWKNGLFNFDNANLETVLRQLSRWYDVDIIFEGAIPQREFAGKMQRNLNLSQVLRILEKNKVQFRVEGKKLIVFN